MTDSFHVSRDCDGLTKLWRHKPIPAEGQFGPLELNEDKIVGDGEPRKPGKGEW